MNGFTSSIKNPPVSFFHCLANIGPGFVITATVVGSGELIATTIAGSVAGFAITSIIIAGCVIKVPVQIAIARATISEGTGALEQFNSVPGPRIFGVNWIMLCWALMFTAAVLQLGGIAQGVGQAMALGIPLTGDAARDTIIWTFVSTLSASLLIVNGRYEIVERISIVLVVMFTVTTLYCVGAMQFIPAWRVTLSDLLTLPNPGDNASMSLALSTFGLIGISTTELIAYPYWCLGKGYYRYCGVRDSSDGWAERAKGWMRVIRVDSWVACAVYSTTTMAFYILGASVLHRQGLHPKDTDLIPTLVEMYVPVFGRFAAVVLYVGAFAVLYSTVIGATAGHSRVCAGAAVVFGLSDGSEESRRRWIKILSGTFPLLSFVIMLVYPHPVRLVLFSGVMQLLMLPLIAVTALYMQYRVVDRRIRPGKLSNTILWLLLVVFIAFAALRLWHM